MSAVMVTGSYTGNSAAGGYRPHVFRGVRDRVGPEQRTLGAASDRIAYAHPTTADVRSRLRLTRRGRVVLTVLSAIPIVVLATSLVLGSGGAAAEVDAPSNVGLSYLTVADGESLWGIAESLAPNSDPREVISEIMRLNGLDDSTVQPGQRLALPAVR
ncbi:LysM peptidoglycan-binding domain-containing protein [Agromyces sp. Marseille-Q5079]|uniref:LysM peptidoglycan-binding domain-containing protein n=1 Tax=Agromyces sp. Marseille-Q5079 TaxID=3439059 RepID=UPI003D9CAB03